MRAQYFEDLGRRKKVAKAEFKRKTLKFKSHSQGNLSLENRLKYMVQLNKLPSNESSTRIRNRCILTGRARGMYSKFKLSRNQIRAYALKGALVGLTKSSW